MLLCTDEKRTVMMGVYYMVMNVSDRQILGLEIDVYDGICIRLQFDDVTVCDQLLPQSVFQIG